MCNPALALAALSIGTTAVTVAQEIKSAKAQNAAISNQLDQVIQQNKEDQTAQMNDRARQARLEQGRIRVAAGEAGLQLGGSVAGLLRDSAMQTALYDQRVTLNTQHRTDAAIADANSMYSQVKEPTAFGAGLRIVSAGVQGYLGGRQLMLSRQSAASAGGGS